MGNRQDLVSAAKKKYEREQLVAQAKAKFASENAPQETDATEATAQTARSAVEGLTMGLSEPVFSGVNAVTGALWSAAQESKDPIEFAQKVADLDRLRSQYNLDVERRRKFEAESPILSSSAEMAGAIAPMIMTGGTSMAAKAATALPEAITATGTAAKAAIRQIPKAGAALESSGLIGSAARIAESGASAAAQAATQDLLKKAVQQPTGFIQPQDEVPSVAESAMFGAKFGAGLSALPEVAMQGARAASAVGKGAARVIGGVKGDVIDAYLANPERIRNAKSIEEIKIEVDSTMQALRDDVDNAVISKDQAKAALKDSEAALDALIRDNKNILQSQKADIKQSLREAERDLNRAFKEKVSDIKTARLPIQPDDVLDSVENVKTQVSDLSSESYKLLGEHTGRFDLKGAGDEIKRVQQDLRVGGQLLSKDSETADSVLQKWADKIDEISKVKGDVDETAYRGTHLAPSEKTGAPAFDLTKNGTFTKDIYGRNALSMYGTGNDEIDKQALQVIRSMQGKPDGFVTVYRAVPSDAKKAVIKGGDWVTTVKNYAVDHGLSVLGDDFNVIEKKVPIKDLFGSADSIHEFGYSPKGVKPKAGGLTGAEVKKVIQELDSDIRSYGDKLAGDFSDKTYNALMNVRRILDGKIKGEVPGYAEIMQETASLNQLRAQFSKLFGRREAVVSKLGKIDSPSKSIERQALQELGKITGKDFKTPLEEYMATKAQGGTPIALENLRQSLPEQEAYRSALAMSARASRPEYGRDLLLKAETSSPQAQAARQAGQAFTQAEGQLEAARGALEPYKKITPQNSENVIRTLLGDRTRKIELKNMMKSLSQVSDQDFVNMIEDLRVKEAFEKPAVQGSRNVNLWALMTGAFGAVMGDPTLGIASAGAGAQVGAFMDMYGPKITRRVLDGMVMMRGMPSVQKINTVFADIPEPVKKDLRDSLIRMVVAGNSSSGIVIPDDMKIEIAQDIKDSKNLSNIEKAKSITEMNRGGAVNAAVMQKVMIGDEKPAQEPPAIQNEEPQVDRLKNVTDFIKSKKVEAY